LLETERPTEPRARSIIASRKSWRWSVVPVAIKRRVPLQIADDLYVIRRICAEAYPARVREGGEERGRHIEMRFAELEQLSFRIETPVGKFLMVNGKPSLFKFSFLPGGSAEDGVPRPFCVLKVAADAPANRLLQRDALFRVLQKVCQAGIEPVIRAY